jgi:hypothetical protein
MEMRVAASPVLDHASDVAVRHPDPELNIDTVVR